MKNQRKYVSNAHIIARITAFLLAMTLFSPSLHAADRDEVLGEDGNPVAASTGRAMALNLYESGVAHYERDQYQTAYEDFTAALRMKENGRYVLMGLDRARAFYGRALVFHHRFIPQIRLCTRIIRDYTEALKLPEWTGRNRALTFFHRGRALHQLGKYQAALNDFETATELQEEEPDLYSVSERVEVFNERSRSLEKLGKYEAYCNLLWETIEFRKNIEKNEAAADTQCPPSSQDTFTPRLTVISCFPPPLDVDHHIRGATTTTIAQSEERNERKKSAREFHNDGFTATRSGRLEEAITAYTRALDFPEWRGAKRAYTLYNRGMVYHKMGQDEKAMADYNEAKKGEDETLAPKLRKAMEKASCAISDQENITW